MEHFLVINLWISIYLNVKASILNIFKNIGA